MCLNQEIEQKIEELIRDENWSAIADLVCSKIKIIAELSSDYLYSHSCSITKEQRKEAEALY